MNKMKIILIALLLGNNIQFVYPSDMANQLNRAAITTMWMLYAGVSIAAATGGGHTLFNDHLVPKIKKHFYKELYVLDELKKEIEKGSQESQTQFIDEVPKNVSFLDVFGQNTQKNKLLNDIIMYKNALNQKNSINKIWDKNRKAWHKDKTDEQIAQIDTTYQNAKNALLQTVEETKTELKDKAPLWLERLPLVGAALGATFFPLYFYLIYPYTKFINASSLSEFIDILVKPSK